MDYEFKVTEVFAKLGSLDIKCKNQAGLARRLKISSTSVSEWKTKGTKPETWRLPAIAEYLECKISDISNLADDVVKPFTPSEPPDEKPSSEEMKLMREWYEKRKRDPIATAAFEAVEDIPDRSAKLEALGKILSKEPDK